MAFKTHDDIGAYLKGADAKEGEAEAAKPQTAVSTSKASPAAMTPPPMERAPDMPKSWDYTHLPQFLQDSIDAHRLKYTSKAGEGDHAGETAYVDSSDPYMVHVLDPKVNQTTFDHELTHTLQMLHPDAKFAPVATKGDRYGYGGADALIESVGKKKLSDYSVEQTARMVQDWTYERDRIFKMAEKDLLIPEDIKRFRQVQAAYAPLMQQMGMLSGKKYPEFKASETSFQDLPEFSNRTVDISKTWAYGELQKANAALQAQQVAVK
jgi:hypothetical protein